jgi:predicted transcriptional regulator
MSTRHGLSRDEYRQRWGLRPDYPLTASAYSERRSTLAKALDLGREPAAQFSPPEIEIAALAPANAAENPKVRRARGLGRSSKSQGAASEAAAPTSAGRRRSSFRVASRSAES